MAAPIWQLAVLEDAPTVIAVLDGATWVDWRFERYTDQTINIQLVDSGGTPVPITGWALRWKTAYVEKSTAAGTIVITAPLSGNFQFTLTAADSLLFPYGALGEQIEHQCKGQEPGVGGAVHILFRGRLRYTGTLITTV